MIETCPHCGVGVVPTSARKCTSCGGGFDGTPPPAQDGTIAKVCPNCSSRRYSRIAPDRRVSFAYDRQCIDCGTTYVVPTPVWGAVAFVMIGIFFVLWGILNLFSGPGSLASVILGIVGLMVGLASAKHGIGTLLQR